MDTDGKTAKRCDNNRSGWSKNPLSFSSGKCQAFMFIPNIAFDVIKHFDNIIPGVILIVVNALFIAKIISSYIIIADKNDVINIDNINENMDDK